MDDHGDLALVADELGHVLGRLGRGSEVVGRRRRDRHIAVHTGVERDHRRALVLGLLHERAGGLAVDRGEAERGGLLVERGLQELDLLLDVALLLRTLERDRDVELLTGLLGAVLHGLPELVPEALRDQRDVRLLLRGAAARAAPTIR